MAATQLQQTSEKKRGDRAPINPINAPTAAFEALDGAESERVATYIKQEFAYEEALEELGGVYAQADGRPAARL